MPVEPQDSFEATYSVPMHCADCVTSIEKSLGALEGVQKVDCDLGKQIVAVTGVAPPSVVVNALQESGLDGILRGTGKPNSAAVAILETASSNHSSDPVRGLVRMVSVFENRTLFDITLNGVSHAGKYHASVHQTGDVSNGVASTGGIFCKLPEPITCAENGHPAASGPCSGHGYLSAKVNVNDLIGRAFVITAEPPAQDFHYGVIARSAGAWENDKQICSCSGKTIWQERKDAVVKNL
ncbi:copper chaperone CCS1 Ecym_2299 [Eremothecium cymbalariae DBVPG|uniref:Superoxide dismutase 1 copper chaperone n=1 Tax=Eremothecium cymbalariae (strain CBS 270.75 / DBVPG 7215 / KCTC 17166 / NRRL Y-17582) TaxID=931890 RepID=G8JQ39_ERECY|nr:Hypothetical protein Ecym_2299 [Eremothecium cymbalariae DBVPG\